MKDYLVGDDRQIALVMATMGIESSEKRLGKRVFNEQRKYMDTLDVNSMEYKHLRKLADYGKTHFAIEAEMSKARKNVFRNKLPNKYQGNYNVYRLVDHLFNQIVSLHIKGKSFKKQKDTWEKSLLSGINRSGAELTLSEQAKLLSEFEAISDDLARVSSAEVFLEDLNYARVGEHNEIVRKIKENSAVKKDDSEGGYTEHKSYGTSPYSSWSPEYIKDKSQDGGEDESHGYGYGYGSGIKGDVKKDGKSETDTERYRSSIGINESKEDSSGYRYKKLDMSVRGYNMDMLILGEIRVFNTSSGIFVLSEIHYGRLVTYLSSLRNAMLVKRDIESPLSALEIADTIREACSNVAKKDANFVGESMKAARQIRVLDMEESMIMGNAKKMYSSEIDPDRLINANAIISAFATINPSKLIMANLLSFYSSLPHPDAPLMEMFESIEGVKNPNPVKRSMAIRFEGLLRKNLFMSMRRSGHDVRLKASKISSKELVDKANDITQSSTLNFPSNSWIGTSFEEVRSLPKISEMSVAIASKASSAGILMTTSEEQDSIAYFAGYGKSVPSVLMKPSTVNDATQEILGKSKMDIERAIKRFEKIIDAHERFEAKYYDYKIDDIPSEDLEKFLKSHPMSQYVVGTEGKFGEVHKRVTRLFYMAEQELKALTQRVERLVKQVTRSQKGVSIVKGYLGRRHDLETSINSMVGKSESTRSVAVSFDMSEFSKRFPMDLVRRYGKILSEVTGESFLERIDLFFRATKVMYSNRGFYAELRGVRGGFEGFLNFTWSSIHAAIMEVALEITGVKGNLLTFSDDGLLIFFPKSSETDNKIGNLVVKIKETYEDLGLIFHLGKTLVSDHMWEYLGDICYNNRLIPMWFKELCKVGRVNPTRGITPLYDKIKVVDSQAGALVVSGCDPLTSYILKRYVCSRILRKWMPRHDQLLLETILVLPTSCGGLRINSPFEDSVRLNISNDAEVFSDFALLDNIEKGMFAKITSAILSRSSPFRGNDAGCRRAILNPSIFKTDLPDTSGSHAINWLLDNVRTLSPFKVPSDPLSKQIVKDIYEILLSAKNVDLNVLNILINSIPGLSEYRSYLGVLKGQGALRLCSRSDLRKAQAMDSKNIRYCINFWHKSIRGWNPASNKRFLEGCIRINYPEIDIVMFRPPPRLVLKRTDNPLEAGIEVSYQHSGDPNIYESEYREPTLKVPTDPSNLNWNSESTGDSELRDTRKFLSAVRNIIAHNPNSEGTVRSICRLFGCLPPSTLDGSTRGHHRDRHGVRRVIDARLILPRYHMRKSESRHIGKVAEFFREHRRLDRTTYACAAIAKSYYLATCDLPIKNEQTLSSQRFYYTIDQGKFMNCFHSKEMRDTRRTEKFDIPTDLDPYMAREYQEYMDDIDKQKEYVDLLEMEMELSSDERSERTVMMVGGMIKIVENYLITVESSINATILTEVEVPRLAHLRTYILRRAVVGAALSSIEPMVRSRIAYYTNQYRIGTLQGGLIDKQCIRELFDRMNRLYNHLPPELREMTPSIGMDDFIQNTDTVVTILVSELFSYTMLSDKKMVIFFSKDYIATNASPDHRVAYRKIFQDTISALFALFAKSNWDERTVAEMCPAIVNLPMDEVIDCLKVLRVVMRKSKHRSIPYNSRTALTMIKKYYMMVAEISKWIRNYISRNREAPKNHQIYLEFSEWLPSEMQVAQIISISPNLGTDHMANIRGPQHKSVIWRAVSRAKGIVIRSKKVRAIDKYNMPINSVIYNIQTAFHETLMANARRKVKAYNHGLGRLIGREFLTKANKMSLVANIQTDTDHVSGKNKLTDEPEHNVVSLLANHLEIIKHDYGLTGFRTGGKLDSDLADMVSKYYGYEGVDGVPTVGHIGDETLFKLFDIRCSNIGKALSSYIHLSNTTRSSISIIKEEDSYEEEISVGPSISDGSMSDKSEEDIQDIIDAILAKAGGVEEDYDENYDYSDEDSEEDEVEEEKEKKNPSKVPRYSSAGSLMGVIEESDESVYSSSGPGSGVGEYKEETDSQSSIEHKEKAGSESSMDDIGSRTQVDRQESPSLGESSKKMERWADMDSTDSDEPSALRADEENECFGTESPEGSLKSFKCQADSGNSYRLIGITDKLNIVFNERDNPGIKSTLTETLAEVVDNLSVVDSLRETESILSSLTEHSNRLGCDQISHHSTIRYISSYEPSPQINNEYTTLQAAKEMAIGAFGNKPKFAAYSAFLSFLRGERDKAAIMATAREVCRAYTRSPFNVGADISFVIRWLTSSSINQGDKLETTAIIRIKETMLRYLRDFGRPLPTVFETYPIRTFEDVVGIVKEGQPIVVGELAPLVYFIEFDSMLTEDDMFGDDDM